MPGGRGVDLDAIVDAIAKDKVRYRACAVAHSHALYQAYDHSATRRDSEISGRGLFHVSTDAGSGRQLQ